MSCLGFRFGKYPSIHWMYSSMVIFPLAQSSRNVRVLLERILHTDRTEYKPAKQREATLTK